MIKPKELHGVGRGELIPMLLTAQEMISLLTQTLEEVVAEVDSAQADRGQMTDDDWMEYMKRIKDLCETVLGNITK